MNFDHTYVKIDLDAIARNFAAVQEKAGVPVMAVVKADAYGHGAIRVARLLQGKCAFFGVSSMPEALELRRAGLQEPILLLGHTPVSAFEEAIRENIRPTIFCYEDALALSAAAEKLDMTARFHFAVDTGMGRIGFQPTEEAADLCARIACLPGLMAEGLFSHFATADCSNLSHANEQAQLFDEFDAMLKARGVEIPIRHLDNSAGIMNFPCKYEMVRSGIVTYGMYPSEEVAADLLELKPALQFLSKVTFVKTLPPGREISYGGTYVTTQPTTVATIPVGYADGFIRAYAGAFVSVGRTDCRVVGRICMDQFMIDVSEVPDVAVGDEVTLIGTDGNETISVEDLSDPEYRFNYEFCCLINKRVPRVYVKDGKLQLN